MSAEPRAIWLSFSVSADMMSKRPSHDMTINDHILKYDKIKMNDVMLHIPIGLYWILQMNGLLHCGHTSGTVSERVG